MAITYNKYYRQFYKENKINSQKNFANAMQLLPFKWDGNAEIIIYIYQ